MNLELIIRISFVVIQGKRKSCEFRAKLFSAILRRILMKKLFKSQLLYEMCFYIQKDEENIRCMTFGQIF